MFKPSKHPVKFPHKVLTGDVAMAGRYLPLAQSLLEQIRFIGLPADVRKRSPLSGIMITVKGGKAIPEHIHIDAAGVQWLAQMFLTDGADDGFQPNYVGYPLYGAYVEQASWYSVTETNSSTIAPRIQGCGNGWAHTLGRSDQGNGWAHVLLHYRGLAQVKSPDFWEYPFVVNVIQYSFADYRLPVFCGFVNHGQGARRRFVVAQLELKSASPIPSGPRREFPGSGPNQYAWRYLLWTEGSVDWEVILPPAFASTYKGEPLLYFRYGPAVYLGNNTLVVWGVAEYENIDLGGGQIEYNRRFQAWRSYDFGENWEEIPDTDIVEEMTITAVGGTAAGFNATSGAVGIYGSRAFTFGQGSVSWQLSHVERVDNDTYNLGTRTYTALAGEGLVEGTNFAIYITERELFDDEFRYPPTVIGDGAAVLLARELNENEFFFKRTVDYGHTWTRVGDFPVDQYIGLSPEHAGFTPSWPYEYYPYVAIATIDPIESQLLIPAQRSDGSIGLFRSVDAASTWQDDGGTISPVSLRWVEDTFFNGLTTPVNVVATDDLRASNPALPYLDEVIDATE